MNPQLQRALLLVEQNRFEMAEQELRGALAEEPEDAMTHAVLGLCLAEREKYKEATDEVKRAIHESPDMAFAHYALAKVLYKRDRPDEARAAIEEAIRLEPGDADYHSLLSAIHFDRREWPAALEAAEHGLQLEAEHMGCVNLRAMALVKLGRKEEAGVTIGGALERDPENAVTHANQGWALLNQGDHVKALEHFREALRIDPQQEWARQGIVEALKARHFIYGIMLRYFLWMSRLSSQAQWGVVLGGYFGYRMLRAAAASNPGLAPYIWPVLILYLVFVLMTWVADPLFNLVLRLNRFGRLALSREQVVSSNWIGGCIFAALASSLIWIVTRNGLALYAALMLGVLVIPLSGAFKCHPGWPRYAMMAYTGALAGLAIATLVVFQSGPTGRDLSGPMLTAFFIGSVLSSWAVNALIMVRPKR